MQIYKFNHVLKTVLWGGDKLTEFEHLPSTDEPIGESWELSAVPGLESVVKGGEDDGLTLTELLQRHGAALVGEEVYQHYGDHFPLLIKFIDAKRDLSIQVHPDDTLAQRRHGSLGKTEMWYIIQADEGSKILTGFKRPMSPEEYERRIADGTILDVINVTESKPGDVFFIPPGQIHAIGAGNLLAEIQQSCDITYRVYDYNRLDANGKPRELHTEQAREALNYNVVDSRVDYTPAPMPGITSLVSCPKFEVQRIDFNDGFTLSLPQPHSFVAMMCFEGATTLHVTDMEPVSLRQGETVLVPAVVNKVEMTGSAQLLTATI